MEKLYSLVSQCKTWLNDDPNGFLQQFFVSENGFTHAFLIALIVAIVCIALFYGWIGMAVNKLSNLVTWLCTLLVDAVVTFVLTRIMVIGSNDVGTGIYHSITEKLPKILNMMGVGDDTGRSMVMTQANTLKETLAHGCDVTNNLLLTNVIITVILFVIISFCVKGMTTHATHVPV